MSKYFSIHFTITGVTKIVVVPRTSLHGGSTVFRSYYVILTFQLMSIKEILK